MCTFTRTQTYTLWSVHTETHTQAHTEASAKCMCALVYADAVGQSACLRTHRCHPAQHNPRATLSQAWGQHGQRLPAPSRPQPLVPGRGCSAQATFKMPQIQADSNVGDPCFLPPVPPELNLEPWGFRLQERTPTVFPGHSEWTLLMASNPEALEAGWVPTGNPQELKIAHKGQIGLCRPAFTPHAPPAWRGSCLPGRLGGGA